MHTTVSCSGARGNRSSKNRLVGTIYREGAYYYPWFDAKGREIRTYIERWSECLLRQRFERIVSTPVAEVFDAGPVFGGEVDPTLDRSKRSSYGKFSGPPFFDSL